MTEENEKKYYEYCERKQLKGCKDCNFKDICEEYDQD